MAGFSFCQRCKARICWECNFGHSSQWPIALTLATCDYDLTACWIRALRFDYSRGRNINQTCETVFGTTFKLIRSRTPIQKLESKINYELIDEET